MARAEYIFETNSVNGGFLVDRRTDQIVGTTSRGVDRYFVNGETNQLTGEVELTSSAGHISKIDHGYGGVTIIGQNSGPGQYTITGQSGSGALVIETVTISGESCLKITNPTPDKTVEIASPLFGTGFAVGTAVVEMIAPQSQLSSMAVFLGNVGYTSFAIAEISMGATSVNNDPIRNGLMTTVTFGTDYMPFVANGGYVHGTTLCQNYKLRVSPQIGTNVSVIIRRFSVNQKQSYGRIAIVSDDNYSSWENTAVPILDRLGLKCSVAVIPDAVGLSAAHSTLAGLKSMISRGHEMVMHGPSGLAGNLIDNYATTEQRMNDVLKTREFLKANGLQLLPRSLDYYVFPQSKFQEYSGDSSLIDAMLSCGITGARTSAGLKSGFNRSCMSSPQSRMTMPILGHVWVSAGTEAAKIAAIKASITELADKRLDGILMFHQVVTDGTESASLHISKSNFTAIMEHIAATCSATLRNVYASDFS